MLKVNVHEYYVFEKGKEKDLVVFSKVRSSYFMVFVLVFYTGFMKVTNILQIN